MWTLQVQTEASDIRKEVKTRESLDNHTTPFTHLIICVFCSRLLGVDGLDAANSTCMAVERCSGLRCPYPFVGIWRTCDKTSFWILCIILETPQASRPGLGESTFLYKLDVD